MRKFCSKKLSKSIYLILVFSASSYVCLAQGKIVGSVTDSETGEGLPGVTLFIPSLNVGTITNIDGTYELSVANGSYNVVASYIGFANQKQKIDVSGANQTLDFTLRVNVTQLEEIVVTGTGGPVEKRKIGNSIGVISSKGLEDSPITSFSDFITGREPGMVALPSGGLTGEGAQIRIRGSASLSQLNEPIILVDGIRIDRGGGFGAGGFAGNGGGGTSRLDDINPESIERIEILKGASAATLFGTEASNGVIQIFTKRGTSGTPKFDVKLAKGIINYPKGRYPDNVGWARDQAQADVMSAHYGETIQPFQLVSRSFTEDLFETGTNTDASVSASGGNRNVTYYANVRYFNEDGPFGGKEDRGYTGSEETLAEDLIRRVQLNANVGITAGEKTKINVKTGYNNTSFSTIQTNNNIYGVGSLAQFSKPELANPDNLTGTIAFATVNEAMQQTVNQDVNNISGSINVNYNPIDWLVIDGIMGVNYTNQISENFRPFGWNIDGFAGAETDGSKDFTNRDFLAQSTELKLSAINTISDGIESDFILGGQIIRQDTRIYSGTGEAFPGPGFGVTGAGANKDIYEFFSEVINAGVFAQEQIGFKDHIFVTVGGRLDAHSAFGANFNAQFYPKIGLSYVLSDAPYWPGALGPISSVQLKASWGQSGLQPGAFDALTTYSAIASTNGAGIQPSNLGNPELKPEVSSEYEIGTNIGILNDKISLSATYWDRTVTDALYARQFPLTGGWRRTQLVNIGELSANGVEIGINANVVNSSDLKVDVFVNGAYLKEEVVSLGGAPPLKVGGSYPRYRNFLVEGFAPGANFGVRLLDVAADELPVDFDGDGLPDKRSEVVTHLASALDPETGEIWELPSNTTTILIDTDYKTAGEQGAGGHFLGKNTPDWQGSFGGTVTYGRFTLRTNFEYRGGNYFINDLTGAFRQANGGIGRNLPTSARVERDYVTGGVAGSVPQNDGETRTQALEEWLGENLALAPFSGLNTLKKGDFIRWRELSISYKLPNSLISDLGLRYASITASGKNIALWTKYPGVDPEISVFGRGGDGNANSNLDQNFGQGVEAFGWAIPTTFIFTLKVGF
ncbi:MAG: SusC/RagA family TonB-linked outer membrane protein [Cyclobacteriaceae bacterium]